MGYYYAKNAGEDKLLYTALKEQYLPNGEDSCLPSNTFSCIVALSNKLDNLMGLFSVDMVPTGSRDPFALRRAALGIVRICCEHNLHLDLHSLIHNCSQMYNNFKKEQLLSFFDDRLLQLYKDVNPSVIKAVIKSGETDILNLSQKIEALNPVVNSDNFKELTTTFKRVANIIKDININDKLEINTKLFEDTAEKVLFDKFTSVTNKVYTTYDEEIDALFSMKTQLDSFFDEVFVNHDNEAIKTNRKNLIGCVYQAFKNIADIKEITI
jgi:glycyl-tRNA synthetase beta chain